eukprot:SAG22_NODE_814_length_7044_cov_24.348884_4_plen_87_part_00
MPGGREERRQRDRGGQAVKAGSRREWGGVDSPLAAGRWLAGWLAGYWPAAAFPCGMSVSRLFSRQQQQQQQQLHARPCRGKAVKTS